MAKRKSNRQARRILQVSIWAYDGAYRISNRKREYMDEDGDRRVVSKPSRRQRQVERQQEFIGVVYSECM